MRPPRGTLPAVVEAPRDKLVGRVLGGWRILEPLARGAHGLLYKAAAVDGPRTAALRVLPPALAGDRETRTRFLRELQVLRNLEHPGLVGLLGYELEGELAWYALEWVAGESLDRLVGPGKQPWDAPEVHRLAREVLETLAVLHRARVVHRGLTPGSLMHDARGRFRIVDLGLVYAAGWRHVTEQGEGLGAAAWQAPEVLRGGEAGPSADLFALGTVLYEAATGGTMWGPDGPVDLSLGRPGSRPPPLAAVRDGFDPGLSGFVETLTGDRPGDRFPDAAAALAALPRAPAGPAGSPAPPRAPRPEGPPGGGRGGTAARLGLALALLGGAGYWYGSRAAEAVHQVEERLGVDGLRLTWKTGTRRTGVVRLVHQARGESHLYRTGPEPTRSHDLTIPLESEVDYRWSILGSGDRELASGLVRRGAEAGEAQGLEYAWGPGTGFAVRFRTGIPVRARLTGLGPDGPAAVHGPDPGTAHALALPPLAPDLGYREPTLELEGPDGGRVVRLLDPEAFAPPLARVLGFLERDAPAALAILPRLFAAGELRVGRSGPYLEALTELGFPARWERHRPLVEALLADPRLDPDRVRLPIYRALTRLEDLDSLFVYMGDTPRFGIRSAYRGLVAAEDRLEAVPAGAVRLGEPGPPLPLLPPAVTTAYTRVVFALSSALTRPEAELGFTVDPARLAAARRARLFLGAGNLHEGLILEVRLGTGAVLSFRGDGQRKGGPRPETEVQGTAFETARYPTFVAGLGFPKDWLLPGPNRLVLRARPLHGIPLTEVTIVGGVHLLLE